MPLAPSRAAARARAAVALVDPAPGALVLEVGCGGGEAAALLCERVGEHSRVIAVDRSAVAVRRTIARAAPHVAAGRLEVREGALAGLDVATASVDDALAVDVNLFWTGPADEELTVLARALRPGGGLHLLYGAGGPTSGSRVDRAVTAHLRRHGFDDVRPVSGPGVVGVVARAPR